MTTHYSPVDSMICMISFDFSSRYVVIKTFNTAHIYVENRTEKSS
jgi:hypothetical protein